MYCFVNIKQTYAMKIIYFLALGKNTITGNLTVIFINAAAAAAKSLQSCPTLCDPIDGRPPCSPVPGILDRKSVV